MREAGFKVVPVVGASAVMGGVERGWGDGIRFFISMVSCRLRLANAKAAGQMGGKPIFPIVMFETPHRIEASLADMAAQFPDRRLTLAREIAKRLKPSSGHGCRKLNRP